MWNNQNNNQPMWRGQQVYQTQTSTLDRSSLIQKVMWFTSFSILSAAAGVFIGANGLHSAYNTSGGSSILWFILEIGLMIGAYALRERPGINFVMLYGFTFVTGVTIAPFMQLLTDAGYGGIILQALLITGALTFALGFYALTTKRDFSGLAPYLFVAVIGLMIVGILNIFLHSAILYSIFMYAGVLIFSFYLIFDVQQAKKYQNTVGNAIALTIGIYLDILNIFLFIIQILMSLQDNR
jgi:modulator of FtsH protease